MHAYKTVGTRCHQTVDVSYQFLSVAIVITSGVDKGGPGQALASPTYINCLPKHLICPVNGIKRSIYSNMTAKNY